mgnify:CR=1 FL=1
MQFFFATPKRLHRVHSHFFMVVLGVAEGGFLLPELLAALAVDVQRHSRFVVLRRIVRHLLHSTTKAHSVAHKITAVIEIHAHRRVFFRVSCTVFESCFFVSFRIAVRESFVFSVSALQLEKYLSFRLPACFSKFSALVCILIRDSCASAFVRSIFRSASNCFAIKFET